jgi:hypothetical protein
VNTPTGSSCGEITHRANKSALNNNTPPVKLDSHTNQRCVVCVMDRTKCGAANPTKAISPVCATALAVAKANIAIKHILACVSGSPKLRAVDSPKLKPSSNLASPHDKITQISQTPNMSWQEVSPTKAVEPNINDCITCIAWGDNKTINEVAAPSTTPTTTPDNNKRSELDTPRANVKVNNTAKMAPQKADPVKPNRINQSEEKILPAPTERIMLASIATCVIPVTKAATPNEAPLADPNKYGSANGLRNKPCATAPANPSNAPAAQAPTLRGKRICHTICCAINTSSSKPL